MAELDPTQKTEALTKDGGAAVFVALSLFVGVRGDKQTITKWIDALEVDVTDPIGGVNTLKDLGFVESDEGTHDYILTDDGYRFVLDHIANTRRSLRGKTFRIGPTGPDDGDNL